MTSAHCFKSLTLEAVNGILLKLVKLDLVDRVLAVESKFAVGLLALGTGSLVERGE